MEQKMLSKWLKLILTGGMLGLAVCFAVCPGFGQSILADYPEFSNRYRPWLIFLWTAGIPCCAALGLGWKIASNIGADKPFCCENAIYLKWIAWLAAGDAVFFLAGNVILLLADMSHPGVTLASLLIAFAGGAVSATAATLSYLARKAAVLQEQNDLTI